MTVQQDRQGRLDRKGRKATLEIPALPAQPDQKARQARIPPCRDQLVQLDLPEKTAQQAQQGRLDPLVPQEQQGRQVQPLLLRDRLVPQGLLVRPDLLGQAQCLRTQLLH